MYTFEKAEVAKDFYMMSSQICNICPITQEWDKDCIMLLGKLKFLFGEPTHMTKNLEQQYQYFIRAVDENGNDLILDVYNGSGGPAIGGLQDKNSQVAANELAEYASQAKDTVNYEYEGYYLDSSLKIRQGIRNGVPYGESEIIPMEEWQKLSSSPELMNLY